MKPSTTLSKDARALLRAARGGDDIPVAERQRILQAFRQRAALDAAEARGARQRVLPRPVRRVAWALAAVISTGNLAALARDGAFDGWGAAIEKMLGTLAGQRATGALEPAAVDAPGRGVSPPSAAEKPLAEQPATAGELARAADLPRRATGAPSSAAELEKEADDDRATLPAGAALPSIEASEREPLEAERAASGAARGVPVTKAVRAPRPRISAVPRVAESSRTARPTIAEPAASRATTPAPDPRASEELDLIVTARNALRARRHADARAAAARHAEQFPRGVFAEEREAILALCACRETGAGERARRFIERRPDSLFSERIRRDCELASNLVPGAPPAGTDQESPPRSGAP